VKKLILYMSLVALVGCSGNLTALTPSGAASAQDVACEPLPARISTPTTVGSGNTLPVTVGCGYVNEPCVSVTICTPGTGTCQTIPNILLDTGSSGLRLFSCVVGVGLTQEVDGSGNSMAECPSYADGSSDWGPIKTADVILGGEKASNVPIQIIDSTFGSIPSDCGQPEVSPLTSGFNGILGVGLFGADCGSACASTTNNRVYFSCSGTNCNSVTAATTAQVTNPVALMPTDNNGVILSLNAVSSAGASYSTGTLFLGVGTSSNNTLGSATVFAADSSGNFQTKFNNTTYAAFIDSGSNGLFFPDISSLPNCSTSGYAGGFYCPSSTLGFSATQIGFGSSPQSSISFSVMDADIAFDPSNPNAVFNNVAGNMSGAFDWGLPFFLGRKVYVGIEGMSVPSTSTTGPYWAY
jgi:hypothetical protein